jgi:hypothetical protein
MTYIIEKQWGAWAIIAVTPAGQRERIGGGCTYNQARKIAAQCNRESRLADRGWAA